MIQMVQQEEKKIKTDQEIKMGVNQNLEAGMLPLWTWRFCI